MLTFYRELENIDSIEIPDERPTGAPYKEQLYFLFYFILFFSKKK